MVRRRRASRIDPSIDDATRDDRPPQFAEPGALEHRDIFYAAAGGDPNGNSYKYPELIRDSTLSVLKGATNQEVFDLAKRYLQILADEARIPIYLEDLDSTVTLEPAGTAALAQPSRVNDATIADLHQQMMTLERTRLAIRV